MIAAGIKLSLLGIAVVFLFLGAMIVVIGIFRRLLASVTEREWLENDLRQYPKTFAQRGAAPDRSRLVAIISAAISAHRERFRR
jgi:sodium pump decarboxylase gamma subunit